jgi:hypothetical protein
VAGGASGSGDDDYMDNALEDLIGGTGTVQDKSNVRGKAVAPPRRHPPYGPAAH